MDAVDQLADLEAAAWLLEDVARYQPQGKRTVTKVIDETPWPLYPRIRLDVASFYGDKKEMLAHMGNATALRNFPPRKTTLVYACWWEGSRVMLTRPQALDLLRDGELPLEAQAIVRAQQIALEARQAAIDVDETMRLLNTPSEAKMQKRGRS